MLAGRPSKAHSGVAASRCRHLLPRSQHRDPFSEGNRVGTSRENQGIAAARAGGRHWQDLRAERAVVDSASRVKILRWCRTTEVGLWPLHGQWHRREGEGWSPLLVASSLAPPYKDFPLLPSHKFFPLPLPVRLSTYIFPSLLTAVLLSFILLTTSQYLYASAVVPEHPSELF